ncbi:MAG TPA: sulfatase [Candidatus Binatia bacterium]|jgi:arylsulfatase A-like enzyme|nr:sulfatase [Candidatus Binatia bacterium]
MPFPLRRSSIALLLLVTACGSGGPPRDAWNVVLVGIDTLRADHLGCYGYSRPTSPRIDGLAAEGTVFRTAISPSPWTLPAFASILTGVLPSRHRAGEGRGFLRTPLDDRTETLATHLRRAGWTTASFVSNGFAGVDVGLAQGMVEHRRAVGIARLAVDDAIAWLDGRAREPFFLFLHIIDPHEPYEPEPRDAEPFIDPAYAGPIGLAYSGTGGDVQTPADRRRVLDLYDGEVHYADRLLGEVLDALTASGVDDRTMVVVVSDHGEELFEHGALGHGRTLYDEVLRVPLVVRVPGGHPVGQVMQQVSTVDVMPTVLDAVGLTVPDGLDGESLLPFVRDPALVRASRPAFAEFLWSGPEEKAIRSATEKLLLTPSNGNTRLYDLEHDPGEQHDLSTTRGEQVAALTQQVTERLVTPQFVVHAFVRGGQQGDVVELDMRLDHGRFHDPRLVDADADDRLTLSADGSVVSVRFVRGNDPRNDVDGVTAAATEGGPVTVRTYVGGVAVPAVHVHGGTPREPVPGDVSIVLTPDEPDDVASQPTPPPLPPDDAPRVALRFVRSAPAAAALAEDTKANLRALGYVE